MSNFLITGGCGFIGAHLVARLQSLGHEVVVLDNLSTGSKSALAPNTDFIHAEASDVSVLRKLLPKVQVCIHLAAIASVSRCDKNWNAAHQSNFIPMLEIMRCIQTQSLKTKVVYASSAAVYGNAPPPLLESSFPTPLSIYGADKLACELLAQVMSKTFQIPSIGLRFFNVYGPGQSLDNDYSGVITIFKEQIMRAKPIVIYGDGKQTRDFIYIDDVIDAIICASNKVTTKSGVYNICSGKSVSILTLAQRIMSILEQTVPIKYGPARRNDIRHSLGNHVQAQKHLGFEAQIPLTKGLTALLTPPNKTFNPGGLR